MRSDGSCRSGPVTVPTRSGPACAGSAGSPTRVFASRHRDRSCRRCASAAPVPRGAAGHGRGAVAAGAGGHPDHRRPRGRHAGTRRDHRPRERSSDDHRRPDGGGRGDRRRGRRTDGAAGGAADGAVAARPAGRGDRRHGRLAVPRLRNGSSTMWPRPSSGGRVASRRRRARSSSCSSMPPARPGCGWSRSWLATGAGEPVPIDAALRQERGGRTLTRRVGATGPGLPADRAVDRASARPAGADPGPGVGADDDDGSDARRHRVRRPRADDVAPQGDADAAALRRVVGHRGRRPPAQQRVVVRAVRRRRAHGRRDRPARQAGPPARPIAQRLGRGRSDRPRAGGRRARRARPRTASSPAPRSCATASASTAPGSASTSAATAGRPTSWPTPPRRRRRRSPDRRGSPASCAATRPRPWRGSGSSNAPTSVAASPSTWASARPRRCSPTSPGPRRRDRRS